jgi:hypothetical protein
MQPGVFGQQLFLGLLVFRIQRNAVYRTDFNALRLIIKADTLGALVGIDYVNLVASGNRIIRTFGLTNITVDTFIGNHQSHKSTPVLMV